MNKNHSMHLVSLGEKAPAVVQSIIEISKGSHNKYEIDKTTGLLMLDRMLWSAVHYPGDYGFLPQTLCEDGDPLDVVILTSSPVLPMTVVPVRVLGVMKMTDDGEQDDKLIGVYDCDPRYAEMRELDDVPKHLVKEMKNFFETYKLLKNKVCKVTDVLGREDAYKVIEESQEHYKQKNAS